MTCACAIALKIAKILAAQASAQSFKNNCGASAIASEIIAPQACAAIIAAQVPIFDLNYVLFIRALHNVPFSAPKLGKVCFIRKELVRKVFDRVLTKIRKLDFKRKIKMLAKPLYNVNLFT